MLARAHADDATVRKKLAMGLFNTLSYAKDEGDLPRRDALLDELRTLAGAHADDAPVREALARGLAKTMLDTPRKGTPIGQRSLEKSYERWLKPIPTKDGWESFGMAG